MKRMFSRIIVCSLMRPSSFCSFAHASGKRFGTSSR